MIAINNRCFRKFVYQSKGYNPDILDLEVVFKSIQEDTGGDTHIISTERRSMTAHNWSIYTPPLCLVFGSQNYSP